MDSSLIDELHSLLDAATMLTVLPVACAGVVVFRQESQCGNGAVTVTAHAASCPLAERAGQGVQEWRTMRFNEVTRQSVGRVWAPQRPGGAAALEMQPECLAMEYLKTMASAGEAATESASDVNSLRSQGMPLTQAVDAPFDTSAYPPSCS